MADTVIVDQKPTDKAPVDPNVKIPSRVAANAAQIDGLYKPAEAEPPQPSDVQGGEETPVTAAVTNEPEQDRNFKAMQGRFNKAEQEKLELSQRLNDVANQLLQAQQQLRQRVAPEPVPAPKLVTEKETQEYGTEFVDVVKRAAREDLIPVVASLQNQVKGLEQQIGQAKVGSLYATLDSSLPNWRIVNQSPQFLAWLKLPEPYSGAIRHGLLTEAFNSGDAARVLRFFQGFLQDEAATGSATAPGTAPGAPQTAAQRQAAVTLGSLAAPGRARTTPDDQSAQSQKTLITHADIAKFYADVRKGVYRGRDTEKDALERQIFAAQADGRVKG